jgi:hypothetical protein
MAGPSASSRGSTGGGFRFVAEVRIERGGMNVASSSCSRWFPMRDTATRTRVEAALTRLGF